MRRKWNIPSEINFKFNLEAIYRGRLEASLISGDSSVHIDLSQDYASAIIGKDARPLLKHLFKDARKDPNAVPPVWVLLGEDRDYVWPREIRTDQIKPLPFTCSNCKARVRAAPLQWPVNINEIYCCFCAWALFNRDITRPCSRLEWDELRLKCRSAGVKHQALLSDDKS